MSTPFLELVWHFLNKVVGGIASRQISSASVAEFHCTHIMSFLLQMRLSVSMAVLDWWVGPETA